MSMKYFSNVNTQINCLWGFVQDMNAFFKWLHQGIDPYKHKHLNDMFTSSFFNSIVQLPKFRFANISHFQNHGNPRIYIGKDIMLNNLLPLLQLL